MGQRAFVCYREVYVNIVAYGQLYVYTYIYTFIRTPRYCHRLPNVEIDALVPGIYIYCEQDTCPFVD